MNVIEFFGVAAFVVRIAYKLLGLIFLWWRKEYRSDRMVIHLRTRQGVTVWGGKTHAILLGLTVLGFVRGIEFFATALLSVFIVALAISYLRKIKSWLVPKISPKVVVIGMVTLVGGIVFVSRNVVPVLLSLAIFDLTLFPLSWVLVVLMSFPTGVYHWWVINNAIRMLRTHKKMTVIGITGSYGKTSVKDYLATVLSERFQTIKTEASKNSPIGIAETLRAHFIPAHEVFVVEMAAYKKGEIREMARMVRPEIGIITAINPQHQDLFGSIENTVNAKYELVQHLVGRKLVIANFDDDKVRRMGRTAQAEGHDVWWWTTRTENSSLRSDRSSQFTENSQNVFRATHITSDVEGVSFECVSGGERVRIHAPVLGAHQVGNLLASVAGAVACGMTLSEAGMAASHVVPAPGVMEKKTGIHGSIFIDDTFNNNPDAAKAAISFLGSHKGKKILVFQPMIELGRYADASHEEVGRFAAAYCDAIILTNENYFAAFDRGVQQVAPNLPLKVLSPQKTAAYIRSHVKAGDMVLFKGKDAEHALTLLIS